MRLNFSFPQIATGDVDVPIVRQLPTADLPLGDEFETGPVKMVSFEAAFGCRGLWKQDLEHAPGNPHDSLIFADADAELDDGALGVPPDLWRKAKEP